jgi:hypothetical protein
MLTPDEMDMERTINLRVRSKMGQHLTDEEMDFLKKMFGLYPEWYASINHEVFVRSAPFGCHYLYND